MLVNQPKPKQGRITIKPIIMTWRSRKDGKAPVAIRATMNRTPRYFPVRKDDESLYLSKKEFANASANASDEISKEHAALIQATVKAVTDQLIGGNKVKAKPRGKTLHTLFREKISYLHSEGSSYSTIQLYFTALQSFVDFAGADATSEDFDNAAVKEYERSMTVRGYSPTTISIYLRCLRSAITHGKDEVKFTKKVLPRSQKRKISVSKDVMKKIIGYRSDNERQMWARDIFVFSYLNGGMNTKDIAMLRWSDVLDDRIQFARAKRQGDDPVVLVHPLVKESRDVIARWGKKDSPYVFGILDGTEKEDRIRKVTNQFTKQVNKHINRVGAELDIPQRLTTYVARHSFATILKRQGVDIGVISEQLGHNSLKTTALYLDSFELEEKKSATAKLL